MASILFLFFSSQLERAKLEKETTSQEQLKEEDPEERRRKEEVRDWNMVSYGHSKSPPPLGYFILF